MVKHPTYGICNDFGAAHRRIRPAGTIPDVQPTDTPAGTHAVNPR